jgi:hypothetical protein
MEDGGESGSIIAVVVVTGLDDVLEPSSLQVHLHHQGPLSIVHPHQRGVDDVCH